MIADITARMGRGMSYFSNVSLGNGTKSTEYYNLYCHYVAGLVGEGLVRLFCVTGYEDPQLQSQLSVSNDMGLFLQKTNIIRDYLEDLVDGRAFWPQDVWQRHVPKGATLGHFTDPNHKQDVRGE